MYCAVQSVGNLHIIYEYLTIHWLLRRSGSVFFGFCAGQLLRLAVASALAGVLGAGESPPDDEVSELMSRKEYCAAVGELR